MRSYELRFICQILFPMVKTSIIPFMYANFYFNMLDFVEVLECCTHNCNKLYINQCQVNAKQKSYGKMIYSKYDVTSVGSYSVSWLLSS